MATCGYLCPKCEGRGFTDEGETCDWCIPTSPANSSTISDEEWMEKVHKGPCCGDWDESHSKESS